MTPMPDDLMTVGGEPIPYAVHEAISTILPSEKPDLARLFGLADHAAVFVHFDVSQQFLNFSVSIV